MNRIEAFYTLASDYCRFLNENEISKDTVSSLMAHLMELYAAALNLPSLEPETDGSSTVPDRPVKVTVSKSVDEGYWEVFDPFVREKPVSSSLTDALSDVASDLQRGMIEWESGRPGNAAFEWKLGLDAHWGHHLVSVLRALHAVRTRYVNN